jgi:hypothetical protein
MDQPPDFTASLPVDQSGHVEIEAVALLRCAAVLLERGRMLTAERKKIDAELCAIGERLQRLHASTERL